MSNGMVVDILNKTTAIVAKRNSGKSVMLKWMVSTCKKFDKIYCICPTEVVNHFYKDFVPDNCIFEIWNESWVEALIAKMSSVNSGKMVDERKNVLLILDDCCSDTNFHSSNALKKLYARGRHINISIIITVQYLNTLPPICRSNSDWLIAGQMNRQSVSILADEYLSGNLDKNEFIKLYHRATKDYNFLVINNTSIKDNADLNQIYGIIKTPSNFVK